MGEPFAALCGAGLCIGYSLLGACWLVRKCHGDVRDFAYRLIPPLSLALLLFLVAVFGFALIEHLPVMNRWLERPYLFVFPAIGIVAAILLAASLQRRSDQAPFRLVAIVFAAAFGTLALSFWPYMIPFSITIEDAAAPHSSLAFMFWGAKRQAAHESVHRLTVALITSTNILSVPLTAAKYAIIGASVAPAAPSDRRGLRAVPRRGRRARLLVLMEQPGARPLWARSSGAGASTRPEYRFRANRQGTPLWGSQSASACTQPPRLHCARRLG